MDGWVWVPRVSGPLAPFAEGFERRLLARGFERASVGNRLWQLAQLSGWLDREGLAAGELTPGRGGQFLVAHLAAGDVSWSSPQSMRLPFEDLLEIGVVSPPVSVPAEGPLEDLLRDYRVYLARERGLVEHTIYGHERVARLFLGERERPDGGLGGGRVGWGWGRRGAGGCGGGCLGGRGGAFVAVLGGGGFGGGPGWGGGGGG